MDAEQLQREGRKLRTLSEIQEESPRPVVTPVARRLDPGELEEIEAAALLGRPSLPPAVLAMAATIRALSQRVFVRFNQAAEAEAKAEEYAAQIRDLKTEMSDADRATLEKEIAHHKMVADDNRTWALQTENRVAELARETVDQRKRISELQQLANARQRSLDEMADTLKASQDRCWELARKYTGERSREREITELTERVSNLNSAVAQGRMKLTESTMIREGLERRIEELKQSLDARDRMLREATGDLGKVAGLAFSPETVAALDRIETPEATYVHRLADVVREVRGILGGSSGPWAHISPPSPPKTEA